VKNEQIQFYKLTNHYKFIELENNVMLNPINSYNGNKFLVFNGTTAAILRKIKNTANINEIVDNLISIYDTHEENKNTVYSDVRGFIDKMIELSIVEENKTV